MPGRIIGLTTAVAVAAATLVAPAVVVPIATSANAATRCVYTPVLPRTVQVNQTVVGLRVPVRVTGGGCAADFSASISLVRGSDSYFLSWDTSSRADNQSVYASSIVPGLYRTAGNGRCYSFGPDWADYSCSVAAASTTIKYAGRAWVSAKRRTGAKKSNVTFTVKAGRYDDYSRVFATTKVAVQRLDHGRWRTIHSAVARGSKGYTWTYKHAASARYRVVSAESGSAFAATSGVVRK